MPRYLEREPHCDVHKGGGGGSSEVAGAGPGVSTAEPVGAGSGRGVFSTHGARKRYERQTLELARLRLGLAEYSPANHQTPIAAGMGLDPPVSAPNKKRFAALDKGRELVRQCPSCRHPVRYMRNTTEKRQWAEKFNPPWTRS